MGGLRTDRQYRRFNRVAIIVLVLFAALCLFPFLLMVIGSFTDNTEVVRRGYSFFPSKGSLDAYRILFAVPDRTIQAYKVTIFVTLVGTTISLFLTTLSGYSLSRPELRSRQTLAFLFYAPTLFNCGLIPWYIMMTSVLKLGDTMAALIIPNMLSIFNIFLVRNYIQQAVPREIFECAKVDGAGTYRTYFNIGLPLIKPVVATLALFIALLYWNDWYLSSLFIRTPAKYSLQYYLYNMLTASQAIFELQARGGNNITAIKTPSETSKLAMAVIATGPMLLLYPFLQKYFVKGLVIGAVKG